VGNEPTQKIVLANPTITETSGRISLEEGCLSFPGLFTTLSRPREIIVRARDLYGEPIEIEATGLLAQAICHEVDHLEAQLLVHHLRGIKKKMFLRRVAKMRKSGVWTA
jgi:peptide deformylase